MEKRGSHAYVVAGHSLILEFGSGGVDSFSGGVQQGRVNLNTDIESITH